MVETRTLTFRKDRPVSFYCVMTAHKGVSSLQLSKEIGTTQKTARFMLQRIREACKQGDFMLCNVVEVDETYIGGKGRDKHERDRLNDGRCTADTADRMAALARGIGGKRLTYKALVG